MGTVQILTPSAGTTGRTTRPVFFAVKINFLLFG